MRKIIIFTLHHFKMSLRFSKLFFKITPSIIPMGAEKEIIEKIT